MRNIRILTYFILLILFSAPFWAVSHTMITGAAYTSRLGVQNDTIVSVQVDSIRINKDSLIADSLARHPKGALDDIVKYNAKDSIVMTGTNWGHLFGESKIEYSSLTLQAERISMNMDSSIAKATFAIDTAGVEFGFPIFSDDDTNYEAKSMSYNLKTKKMFVNEVITEQGEGYITAKVAKRADKESFYMSGGRYTTCSDHDCPHFYFALTRAKVRPKKDVVTGPAYLVIEGLPLPLGLPFGYFPFSDKYSSGIIPPSFGDEMDRGFFLKDGGYYFALSEHFDLTVLGQIYTKGTWGMNAKSNYRKRYKFAGNFDLAYLSSVFGDKGLPDYSKGTDMRINWTHSQDPKANMFRTLSASVNFTTSSYNKREQNSWQNPNLHTQNTASSSVNLTQRFPNSPWNLSASTNIDQRSRDSTVSLTLPNLSATMSRIQPFKRKNAVGERWYERIQVNYRGEFKANITEKENQIFKADFNKWDKAVKHSIPVSATYNLFNHLNITPSFNYTERWYFEKRKQAWDADKGRHIVTDTINGFSRVWDFSASLSMQTMMYGFYKPLFDKKSTIRHVFTPSVSLNYAPDFSESGYGYYESYEYYDGNGELRTHHYSLFDRQMFGTPSKGKRGSIDFSFDNNIEMKREMNDTIKKISLIDNFGLKFSYNMMAPEFRWSNVNTNMRLKLSKSLTVNLNATWDPYTYDLRHDREGNVVGLDRVDKMRFPKGLPFGRLMSTGYSISPSINQDTFKKWFGKNEEKKDTSSNQNDENNELEQNLPDPARKSLFEKKADGGEYDADGYLKNNIKWSFTANYSFNYAYNTSRWNEQTKEYKYKLVHNLGFNGNIQPTQNWNFSFSSSYDFERSKVSYLNCSISRNLHCWTLSASFIPLGQYKSYFVSIRASSSMLQDLKYDKRGRSSSYDPMWD